MDPHDVPPASMADLIDLDVQPQRVWRASEVGEVFRHELATPLATELDGANSAAGDAGMGAREDTGGAGLTVGDLLHQPHPPLALLLRLKDFAKRARHDPQSHLPEDVAAAVYALALAAALARHGRRISSMGDGALAAHFAWAAGRPWLDRVSLQLLRDAAQALHG